MSLKHVHMSTLECYSTFNALSSGLNLINLGSKRKHIVLFGRGLIKF